ncbi:RrF2 family transcriptional regulator [Elongatibacter sediminis]|uniref:Rrf2 family transcriptional regulator n=1 Tax=Elongatibacter sediminis TaxID=3119006 RepID=A0AAW9RBX7_9GAMM
MRITSFTDFGLRVLMYLAATRGTAVSTGEIAATFDISQHHLAKVVRALARGGFVQSQRGRNGGLSLGRQPQNITLGEVVRHLEQRIPLVECFREDGGHCRLNPDCRLKSQLAAAQEAFINELDKLTIEDCAWHRARAIHPPIIAE